MHFEVSAHKSLGKTIRFTLSKGHCKRGDDDANETFSLEGLRALPAGFDVGTTLFSPGFDENETTEALEQKALAGGYSSLLLRPKSKPEAISENDIYAQQRAFKKVRALSAGLLFEGDEIAALHEMTLAGAHAFWDAQGAAEPQKHIAAMRYLESVAPTTRACFDAIDPTLSEGVVAFESRVSCAQGLPAMPVESEALAIARIIELYSAHEHRLHLFNICTARGVALVEQAQESGMNITASSQLLHLMHDERALEHSPYDRALRTWPPLASAEDKEALLRGLEKGVIFFTSGHCCVAAHKREDTFVLAQTHQETLQGTMKSALFLLGDDLVVDSMARARSAFGLAQADPSDIVLVDAENTPVLLLLGDRVAFCGSSAPLPLKNAARAVAEAEGDCQGDKSVAKPTL